MPGRGDDELRRTADARKLGISSRAEVHAIGLRIKADVSFHIWKSIGLDLAIMQNASSWWLGDWLIYGEGRYPDRYRDAIARTRLEYQTLRNYAYVCRAFPMYRRRDKISFQHHAELAALSAEEQDSWLDKIACFKWSRGQLRNELRAVQKNGSAGGRNSAEPVVGVRIVVDQRRHEQWRAAANHAQLDLNEWIVHALDYMIEAGVESAAPTNAGESLRLAS